MRLLDQLTDSMGPLPNEPVSDMPGGVAGSEAALEEDMLDVDFDDWLNGKDLPVPHLDGQLGGMSRPFEWPLSRTRKRAA